MSTPEYALLIQSVGDFLRLAMVGTVTINRAVRPERVFEIGELGAHEGVDSEKSIELSATSANEPAELSDDEKLALAVLASNDRAAGNALTDKLLENGVDWAEKIREAAVAYERERVADLLDDFSRLVLGDWRRVLEAAAQAVRSGSEAPHNFFRGALPTGPLRDRDWTLGGMPPSDSSSLLSRRDLFELGSVSPERPQ